jgi:acyl carrier protein
VTEAEARELALRAVREVAQQDGVTPTFTGESQKLRDLGISSLTLLELVSVLEELGGFSFRDEDVDSAHFDTLGSTVALLERYPPS